MAGRWTNRPLSGVLPDPFFPRTSLSQSIREGHEHLLKNESHEDIELRRRVSDIDSGEDRSRQHLERLFRGSEASTDGIPTTPTSFSNDIPQATQRIEKKVNFVKQSDYGASQQAVPGIRPIMVRMWDPFWLKKAVLTGFALLFALMLIALGLLYHFATVNDGLSTQLSRNHYSWTYGPTAFLIFIISSWRQVDYWCRALVPWQEMRGFATAERSMLLDYISPNPIIVVLTAFKRRHWLVILSTVGLFLLKLIAVFSTALLTLQPTSMTTANFPLINPKILAARNFNGSAGLPGRYNGVPVLTYYGLLDKGLPYPQGTLADKAYEPVEPLDSSPNTPASLPNNASVTASTFAFLPDLQCEVAQLNATLRRGINSTTPSDMQTDLFVDISTPDCTIQTSTWTNVLCDPHWQECPERDVLSWWYQTGNEYAGEECKSDGPHNTRLFFGIADMRYAQSGLTSDNGGAKTWSTTIAKTTGILCHPSYSIRNATITVDYQLEGSNGAINVTTSSGPGFQLDGFSNLNLTNIISSTLSNTPKLFGVLTDVSPYHVFSGKTTDILYRLMMLVNNNTDAVAFLDDHQTLINAASTVFNGISAQIARQYLFVDSGKSAAGTVTYLENRLHVKVLSVWLMAVGLAFMTLVAILVFWLSPRKVVTQDPTTIGAIATILSSSESLSTTMMNAGHLDSRELSGLISGARYQTAVLESTHGQSFAVEHRYSTENNPQSSDVSQSDMGTTWYRPISVRIPVLVFAILFPIALIISLEILQKISDRNDGFVNVGQDTVRLALTEYIPAAIMLLFAALVSSMSSTIKILAPFVALAKGNAPARRGIHVNFEREMMPASVVKSLRQRHPAVFFSTVAASLSSVLTIVVSGLYVRESVPLKHQVLVQQADQFNLTWNNSVASDSSAGTMINLVQHTNLSYPQWTYDELAFPFLKMTASSESLISHATNQLVPLTVQVPAFRASLNCSRVPYQNVNVTLNKRCTNCTDHSGLGPEIVITARVPLPPNCQLGGQGGNLSYIDTFTFIPSLGDYSTWAYGGQIHDLHVGPWSESYFDGSDETSASTQPDNPSNSGCPSLAFTFGQYKLHENASTHTTILVCDQIIEQVQTYVRLQLPDFIIDPATPPIPDESTAKPVGNADSDSPFSAIREYRIQENLSNELSGYIGDGTDSGNQNFDFFYQAIIYGQGVDPATLTGPDNVDNLIAAIEHFYRQYMAQVLNFQLRQPLTPPSITPTHDADDAPTFMATFTDSSSLRLKQDSSSKLALQILLGIIILFGITAHIFQSPFFRGGMRHLLHHSPSSIAGTMSLVAGSEIVERLKDNARGGNRVFGQRNEGWMFSLGWWGEEECGTPWSNALDQATAKRRRFGIDIGRADG